jgi:hypothetical protein
MNYQDDFGKLFMCQVYSRDFFTPATGVAKDDKKSEK